MTSVKFRKSSPINSVVDGSEFSTGSSDELDIAMAIRKQSAEDVLSAATDPIILSQGLSFTSGSILQSSPVATRRSPSPASLADTTNLLRPSSAQHTELFASRSSNDLIGSSPNTTGVEIHGIAESSTDSLGQSPHVDSVPNVTLTTNDQASNRMSTTSLVTSTSVNTTTSTTNSTAAPPTVQPSTTTATTTTSSANDRPKGSGKVSERAKKKAWYSVLYPSYKSRSEDFKKLFKGVPDDERLVVDYSCAVQRDILVHGRLYVSQNYLCFYANIFRWETCLSIRWKDVTAITKEKTALVIPNAILVSTANEKYFIASFTSRDKAYLMLFRVWQNALMDKPMQPQEMWQWVHNCYGDELGLTSDDEDYIDPYENAADESTTHNSTAKSTDSVSEDQADAHSDVKKSSSKKNQLKMVAADSSSSKTTVSPKAQKPNASRPSSSSSKSKSSSASPKVDQFSAASSATIKLPHRKLPAKPPARKRLDASGEPITAAVAGPIISTASCEQLPTDMSESSDSDSAANIPFVSTAECNSMHEGRQLVHTILPINVDTLFALLFSKSKFLVDFHNIRKTTNMVHEDWQLGDDGLKCRKVKLTVALTQAVGPKCSHVTENQVMRECSAPSQLYSIDITSTNAGIPYADSFYVFMHYCLVRTVDDHTMFSVHAQVKYKKSVWGVVKGFIEKNTWAGLEDFYTALLRALQSEYCIPPAKAKGRRTRRGASGGPPRVPLSMAVDAISSPNGTDPVTGSKSPFALCSIAGATAKAGHPDHTGTLSVAPDKQIPSPMGATTRISVVVLMISLVLLNVILYLKLWRLEEDALNVEGNGFRDIFDFNLLKNSPNSQEDWMELLQKQEAVHATETIKWQHIINSAIELLRKTEDTLGDLLALINLTDFPTGSAVPIDVNADTGEGAFE